MTQKPHIVYLEEVGSTNQALRERLQSGDMSEGVLWAGKQTAGRGRLGRKWESPEGGLYYSIAVRAGSCPPPLFGFAAGLVAHLALAKHTDAIRLKWPNDLLAMDETGQECKLGGMLSEYVTDGVEEPHVIIGLGININTKVSLSPDAPGPTSPLPPLSLSLLTGETYDLPTLVQELTAQMIATLRPMQSTSGSVEEPVIGSLHKGWSAATSTLGRRVRIEAPGRTIEGVAEKLDSSFGLCLRDDAGAMHTIQAGDCIHLR